MSSPSSPDDFPSSASTTLEDTAIAWLMERDEGWAPGRERAFAAWLRSDPGHAAAVARLEQTLGLLHELPEYRTEVNTEFDRAAPVVPFYSAPAAVPVARRRTRVLLWWSVAAAVLALGIGWRVWHASRTLEYRTTVAGYERALLNDGSTLELNAATAVRVSFTAAERHVELESGEAHFTVAHDTTRPFVVRAGGIAVRAVGTAFNVRYTAAGVEVTVVEGKVRVGQHGADSAAAASAPLVVAGERLRIPQEAPAPVAEKISPVELRQVLAWQGRLVEFAEAPLSEVIARFNVRNRVQLLLSDAELGAHRVGGTFAIDEPEAFVRLLERDGAVVVERRGDGKILLQRAR